MLVTGHPPACACASSPVLHTCWCLASLPFDIMTAIPIDQMDPIVATLIQSNEPLSEPQALHVRQALNNILSSLSSLEEEILRVLLSLEARKGAAPAQRIRGDFEREILAEIFLMCRDDVLGGFRYSVANPRSRIAARDCGTISISSGPLALGTRQKIFCVRYSQGLAISPSTSSWPADEDVLALLFHQAHRLKDVRLDFPAIDLPPRLFDTRSLPILSAIEIRIHGDISHILSLFNDAPQLQSVYLYAHGTPTFSLVSAPWWSQLTRLVLYIRVSLREAQDILIQCKMIQDCQLIEMIPFNDFAPSQNAYRLNHLQNLTTSIRHAPRPETFFDAFSFPKLASLNIMAYAWFPHILPDLYDRSNFRLTDLVLQRMDMGAEELITFLRNLPDLETLHLSYCGVGDALFRAFTYHPGNPLPSFAPGIMGIRMLLSPH
ncbi:hypothetical protein FB451DRAFT_1466685 [Mycena latifolia]|nr:hypothetical protein FB451DRAFT_1466685 [Mycena latifolia]